MQALLDRMGQGLHAARLEFIAPDGARWTLGQGEPHASVLLRNERVLRRILADPRYAFAETYCEGAWDAQGDDLPRVLGVATRIQRQWEQRGGALGRRLLGWWDELNGLRRARRNVQAHYDLPASFYADFLDADLHYSCAYFRQPHADLERAQQDKCAHIARKLALGEGARVLDIGCGFGSLAMYLAAHGAARVRGITLSQTQLECARERVAQRGLNARVELALQDYRTQDGCFDAVVSVGMFEHVGRPQYRRFFTAVRERLREGGTALIHSIGRSSPPAATNPWIRRHIFPGGYIPAASEMLAAVEQAGLVVTDLEVWREHYAHTLAAWAQRFERALPRWQPRLGEGLCRRWRFYLRSCEAAFRWGDLVVFQLQLARPPVGLPITRDYLYA